MTPSLGAGELEGGVALVNGGGSVGEGIGNGRAAAILLARAGARVAVVDRDAAAAELTCAMIADEGNVAKPVVADVTDDAACAEAVARTVSDWGALTVLVNNVGIAGPRVSATEVDLDAWDAAMRVNVRSFVSMVKHSVPHMAQAGGGAIVNVASIAGYLGAPQLLYSTSKGAVINMTRSMAVAHGPQGVRVNAVAPGHVYTPMVSGMTAAERERRRAAAPLRVEGSGWDVGHAVTFLAGPRARWITGVVLPVDGGLTCAMV